METIPTKLFVPNAYFAEGVLPKGIRRTKQKGNYTEYIRKDAVIEMVCKLEEEFTKKYAYLEAPDIQDWGDWNKGQRRACRLILEKLRKK